MRKEIQGLIDTAPSGSQMTPAIGRLLDGNVCRFTQGLTEIVGNRKKHKADKKLARQLLKDITDAGNRPWLWERIKSHISPFLTTELREIISPGRWEQERYELAGWLFIDPLVNAGYPLVTTPTGPLYGALEVLFDLAHKELPEVQGVDVQKAIQHYQRKRMETP